MKELAYEVTEVSTLGADRRVRSGLWESHTYDLQGTLSLKFGDAEHFFGATKVQRWQDRAVVEFVSGAVEYQRTPRHIASGAGEASTRLIIPLKGQFSLTAKRDTVTLTPGSVGIFRMDEPMSLRNGNGARGVIASVPDGVITRRLADNAPPLLEQQRPLVAMLISHVTQIRSFRNPMTAQDFVRSTEVMFHLLEGVLDENRVAYPDKYATAVARIRAEVLRNSDDPLLTPDSLAVAAGCSLSYLHKALKSVGTTPARLLRTIRLAKARDRLSNPRYQSIDEIAYESGFGSMAAFHQNFVKHFGMTPGQMREQLTRTTTDIPATFPEQG